MRYLIFTLALISAFFVSKSQAFTGSYSDTDYKEAKAEQTYFGWCDNNGSDYTNVDKSACKALATEQLYQIFPQAESITEHPLENGYNKWRASCSTCGPNGGSSFMTSYYKFKTELTTVGYSCPPDSFPDYKTGPVKKSPDEVEAKWCLPSPDSDPDCPAPTDNDPFVFGSGGGQTSVCFPAQNGRQCEIQTDENGGYYIPVSYGSSEPVSCIPDIDPSPDPEPTPDPDPKPDPEPTDPTPETTELDAINKINENLDVINQNQSASSESNDERLDRIAIEIQNSNQILSDIKSKPVSSGGSRVNNGALLEIAENTKKDLYNGECEGELCDYDIQPKLDEENAKLKEWIEKEEPAPSILNTYTSKISSYVSQNFAGFTGTCKPFILDVSIANVSKTINVHQHCEPYETYFKPLVEWLLWTFTAIALINISSQAFRAFSSL